MLLSTTELDINVTISLAPKNERTHEIMTFFFFFEREFQHMASTPDDNSLSSDQDTNQFLM